MQEEEGGEGHPVGWVVGLGMGVGMSGREAWWVWGWWGAGVSDGVSTVGVGTGQGQEHRGRAWCLWGHSESLAHWGMVPLPSDTSHGPFHSPAP